MSTETLTAQIAQHRANLSMMVKDEEDRRQLLLDQIREKALSAEGISDDHAQSMQDKKAQIIADSQAGQTGELATIDQLMATIKAHQQQIGSANSWDRGRAAPLPPIGGQSGEVPFNFGDFMRRPGAAAAQAAPPAPAPDLSSSQASSPSMTEGGPGPAMNYDKVNAMFGAAPFEGAAGAVRGGAMAAGFVPDALYAAHQVASGQVNPMTQPPPMPVTSAIQSGLSQIPGLRPDTNGLGDVGTAGEAAGMMAGPGMASRVPAPAPRPQPTPGLAALPPSQPPRMMQPQLPAPQTAQPAIPPPMTPASLESPMTAQTLASPPAQARLTGPAPGADASLQNSQWAYDARVAGAPMQPNTAQVLATIHAKVMDPKTPPQQAVRLRELATKIQQHQSMTAGDALGALRSIQMGPSGVSPRTRAPTQGQLDLSSFGSNTYIPPPLRRAPVINTITPYGQTIQPGQMDSIISRYAQSGVVQ